MNLITDQGKRHFRKAAKDAGLVDVQIEGLDDGGQRTEAEFICSIIFPDELHLEGRSTVHAKFKACGGALIVEYWKDSDLMTSQCTLMEGDVFRLSHAFEFASSKVFFPLTFRYNGVEYHLNKTKNGKLILTK